MLYIFVMFVLTCWHVYSSFWSYFFQIIKFTNIMTDYNSRGTVIANKQQYQLSPNPPRSFWFVHSLPIFLLSLPFLPSFSPVLPSIGFCDATGTVTYWWVDSILWYARQLTNFYVLAIWYALASRYTRSSPKLQLTSACICSFYPFVAWRSPSHAEV